MTEIKDYPHEKQMTVLGGGIKLSTRKPTPELANNILGHRDFLSALSGLTQNPRVFVGQTSSVDLLADETEQDEDNFYVSVRGVLKDIHQLAALADLTRVLLDVLDENGCLAEAGS